MDEVGEAYRGVRLRVSTLVTGADVTTLDAVAPATPDWTVHDVLAHLVGVATDIVSGNLDGVGSDPWAAAQVDRSRERTCVDLLAEWDEHGPVVDEMAAQFGRAAGQLLSDATTHEHDVRGALGCPGARDSETIDIGLRFMVPGLLDAVAALGVPILEVQAGGRAWRSGEGEPAVRLPLEPFEALRSLCGRRSPDQLRSLPWTGDPEPYLEAFTWGPFTPPATAVVE